MKKTHWKGHASSIKAFFCPLCRSQRRVPLSANPWVPKYIFQIVLLTAIATMLCWPLFELKGVVLFVPFWIIFEVSYRLRMRAIMPCPNCGFDPFLYMTNVGRARAVVDDFWRKKFLEKGIPFPGDPLEAKVSQKETTPEDLDDDDLDEIPTRQPIRRQAAPNREGPFPTV